MKKLLKRYLSIQHILAFLRRQPKHVKHVYAFLFAGSITSVLAFLILYFDYGLLHDVPNEQVPVEEVILTKEEVEMPSPKEVLFTFFGEAKENWNLIKEEGKSLLESKEVYNREDEY